MQAGHWDSEGQQRLVSLTAQVTAQAAQLAAEQQRAQELLVGGKFTSQCVRAMAGVVGYGL